MNVVKKYRDRQWQVTGGLVPGYAGGQSHNIENLVSAHHQFLKDLGGRKMPAFFTASVSSYGFSEADGSVTAQSEPGWIASGSLHAEHGKLSDQDVLDQLLLPLAERLALAARQTRVYVLFAGETMILEVPRPEGAVDHRDLGRTTT